MSNPNITATDEEGTELDDVQVEVNGAVPGSGGSTSDTDTRTDVSDDGTTVVADVEDINLGAGVTAVGDGDNTVTVRSRPRHSASGQVASTNAATVRTVEVADGESYAIYAAGLLLADGQPVPTDLDLVIATLDNAGAATRQAIVVNGDGTKQNDLSGSPLASYSNSTGGPQTVAVMVDNGQFNSGTGSKQDIVTHFDEEVA